MRAALLCLAACSSMPGVNGDTLGESGTAMLSVSPDTARVAVLGTQFQITNTGDGASGAIGAVVTGDGATGYAIGNSTCSELQPGASCEVDVHFLGQSSADAKLDITENNEDRTSASLQPGDLSTTALIKVVPESTMLADSSCGHGFSLGNTIQIDVINATGIALTSIAATTTDLNLVITGCTSPLGVGAMCKLSVGFAPGAAAESDAAATIDVQAMGNGMTFPGSAQISRGLSKCLFDMAPELVELVSDAPITVGTGAEQTVTITNFSDDPLTFDGSQDPIDPQLIASTQDCIGLIAGTTKCTWNIAWTPSAVTSTYVGELTVMATTADATMTTARSKSRIAAGVAHGGLSFEHELYDWGGVVVGQNAGDATEETIVLRSTASTGGITVNVLLPWVLENGNNTCKNGIITTGGAVMTCSFRVSLMAGATPGLAQTAITAAGASHGSASAVLSAFIQ